ncbi:GLPGLI family protein [Gillisia hiemivivida]|uniref:GLPGLI family protein n=1 Tax=Gillisia hiemivivida TaxID=291190 RepID=A0A5C6ZXB6_9FLAO|nr:GLPGLI family protein [Gillisia hiemivivida]TXD94737.1 GLPGLI family protein [Gillisia hiemivivida]
MKTFCSILLLCFVFNNGFSQKLKDHFNYKVMYKLTYQLDSTDVDSEKSEYMTLFLGDDYSMYSSRAKTLANQVVYNGNTAHTSRAALTYFHYEIIKEKEKETRQLFYTLKVPKMQDHFYYVQDKNLFDWKVENETKFIKEYKVQKATTSFAGREYVAWFATEIPISDGPYKFNGLPGLILEIYDTEKHWNFEFFGFKKLSPKMQFKLNLNQYVETTQEELQDLWYRYRRDPMGYANNPNVKASPEVKRKLVEAFTKMLEKENNPLEFE